jgi:hypothetical protein
MVPEHGVAADEARVARNDVDHFDGRDDVA